MKRRQDLFMVAVLVSQTLAVPMARAQTIVPGMAPIITAAPGDYNVRNEDTTRILTAILDRVGKLQDSDLQFVQNSVAAINADYADLVRKITVELKKSSDDSRFQAIAAKDFLAKLREVQEAKLGLDAKLVSLSGISRGALPSQATITAGGQNLNVGNYRQVDMSQLVSYYSERLNSLMASAQNYFFKIQFPSGQVQIIAENSGSALTPRLDIPVLSSAEIKEMQNRVTRLQTPSMELVDLMDSQSKELKRLIRAFVSNYGTSERYRFKDDNDRKMRDEAFKAIVDMFWTRSYLRLKFGITIGAVQPATYQKRWVNIDKFTVSTEALGQFREERAESEVELANAAENIRNTLQVVDERSTDIMNGDASLLIRANALLTFLGGHQQTAEALLMIMRLVAADIKEEQMMRLGSLSQTRAFYQTRYQTTEETKGYYTALKCSYDGLLSQNVRAKDCQSGPFQDVVNNSGSGLRNIFNQMQGNMVQMAASLKEAKQIQDQILAALNTSGALGDVDDRADDL